MYSTQKLLNSSELEYIYEKYLHDRALALDLLSTVREGMSKETVM